MSCATAWVYRSSLDSRPSTVAMRALAPTQGLHGQPGDIRQRQGMGQRPFPVGPGGHHQVSPGNDQHRIFHTAVRRQVGLAGEEEIGHILAYGQAIPDQAVQLSRYLV